MFNQEFLHVIRRFELEAIMAELRRSARVLEIGAGTGYQAYALTMRGYHVEAVDVEGSNYRAHQIFPVQTYDGVTLPFVSRSFDIVFSSNVLEHVVDLAALHREIERVLAPGGYCVHVMPTASWRAWTIVAHYIELVQRVILELAGPLLARRGANGGRQRRARNKILGLAKFYLIVPRHGERGNALMEMLLFSQYRWLRHFRRSGYRIERCYPMGLFYTGHMVLGHRLPIALRRRLAHVLGSACVLYRVRPTAAPALPTNVMTQHEGASAIHGGSS